MGRELERDACCSEGKYIMYLVRAELLAVFMSLYWGTVTTVVIGRCHVGGERLELMGTREQFLPSCQHVCLSSHLVLLQYSNPSTLFLLALGLICCMSVQPPSSPTEILLRRSGDVSIPPSP